MMSKNNKKIAIQKTESLQPHYGLRKLTIGVASVLLGTTLFLGENQVYADSLQGEVSNNQNINEKLPISNKIDNNTVTLSAVPSSTPPVEQTSDTDSSSATTLSTNNLKVVNSNSSLNNRAMNLTRATIAKPHFTGATSIEYPQGTTMPQGQVFKTGDEAQIKYTAQSWGGTEVSSANLDYQGTGKFFLIIPKGFTLDGNFTTAKANSSSTVTATFQRLGKLITGEETWLMTTQNIPSYSWPLYVTGKIKVDGSYIGGAQYTPNNGLFLADADSDIVANNPNSDQISIKLANGTTYQGFNSVFMPNISYYINPGVTAIDQGSYQVLSHKVSVVNASSETQAGYEQLNTSLQLTQDISAGTYVDIRLGLPYQDSKTGESYVQDYDSQIANPFDVTYQGKVIGTVYNIDAQHPYYRLVFNENINQFSNPTINLTLRWGSSTGPTASATMDSEKVKNLPVLVYQATTDKAKNLTTFAYSPQDDIQIGNHKYTSGLIVNGQYYYTAGPIIVGNSYTGFNISASWNRTWNAENNVSINTNWQNSILGIINLTDTTNEFDLVSSVANDPDGLVSYEFTDGSSLAAAIKKNAAKNYQYSLTNSLDADTNTYLSKSSVEKSQVKIAVTVTDPKITIVGNRKRAVWHVKVVNLDPQNQDQINLFGGIPLVEARARNFTLPENVKSYQEDLAAAKTAISGNYGNADNLTQSAKTGNTALMHDLQNLPVVLNSYIPYHDGQPETDKQSWPAGSPWISGIAWVGNRPVTGGASASDLISADLVLVTPDKTQAPFSIQAGTGSSIVFGNEAQAALQHLLSIGYQIDYITTGSINGPHLSGDFSQLDLSTYSFGTLSKNNPTKFFIHLKSTINLTGIKTGNLWFWKGSRTLAKLINQLKAQPEGVQYNHLSIYFRNLFTNPQLPEGYEAWYSLADGVTSNDFDTNQVGYIKPEDTKPLLNLVVKNSATGETSTKTTLSFGLLILDQPQFVGYEVPLNYGFNGSEDIKNILLNYKDEAGYPIGINWIHKPDTSKPGFLTLQEQLIYNTGDAGNWFGKIRLPGKQVETIDTISVSKDANFKPLVIHGTTYPVEAEISTLTSQVTKLIVNPGKQATVFTADQTGQLVNQAGTALVAGKENESLVVDSSMTQLSPQQLATLLNTSLLQRTGLPYQLSGEDLKVEGESLTGKVKVQVGDPDNCFDLLVPVKATIKAITPTVPTSSANASQGTVTSASASSASSQASAAGSSTVQEGSTQPASPSSSASPASSSAQSAASASTVTSSAATAVGPASSVTTPVASSAPTSSSAKTEASTVPTTSASQGMTTSASASSASSQASAAGSSTVQEGSTQPASPSSSASSASSSAQSATSTATSSSTSMTVPASSAAISSSSAGKSDINTGNKIPTSSVAVSSATSATSAASAAVSATPVTSTSHASSTGSASVSVSNTQPAISATIPSISSVSTSTSAKSEASTTNVSQKGALSSASSATNTRIMRNGSFISKELNQNSIIKLKNLGNSDKFIDPLMVNKKLGELADDKLSYQHSADDNQQKLPQTSDKDNKALIGVGMIGLLLVLLNVLRSKKY